MASSPTIEPASSSRDFLSGGGEMGALMRTMDWSNTLLGPIEQWPQSLRTSVSICLASRFPIVLYWGPDYVVLYNDAYSAILGSKHPWALGRRCSECWAEIWDTIGPMLDGVTSKSEATWSDNLLLQLHRFGYPEECYFSFSFSPIRVETGGVGGVFTAVIETTARLIAERRLNTLRELAARVADADSETHMCSLAMETLGRNRYDFSFSIMYLLSRDRKTIATKGCAGIRPDHPLCSGRTNLDDHSSPLMRTLSGVVRSGQPSVITDLDREYPGVPMGIWGIAPVEAIALPIMLPGHTVPEGCLLVGLNARKRLDQEYRIFLSMIASQLAANLSAAKAHEEERRRVEMLAELDRAKTAFFSNVSHEFRTPITLMVGPVEAMLERAQPTAEVSREELQLVHRNSLRLLRLVNTLLEFSRIEAGRIQAIYEPTDLATLTTDTACAFGSAMDQAGLKFVIDCPPLPEPAYVDRDMWEKIVLNLISNAFKFTLSGSVTVRLRPAEDRIELRVEDTGLGIPRDQQPKLFQRFHRVENARGRTHEGTGIGLALVQELAKLHQGSVRVESVEGQGSTFIVSIPQGKAHLPADQLSQERILSSTGVAAPAYVNEALRWLPESERPAQERHVFAADSVQAPHVQTATGRILLADDNADMRDYIRRLLGDYYEVHAVANGVDALAMIRELQPDLVLTDAMMPELDGFGLLHELRANPSTATIPVILLSARAGEDARIEGMEAGADDYMVKPFTARELLARVGAHLTLGRLRREHSERERSLRAELEIRVDERTSELEAANQELRELSFRLLQMQDEERRKLARDLHDSVGQLLAALAMNIAEVKGESTQFSVESQKRIDENAVIVQQMTREIRTISHLLHPPLLDEVGLMSALQWYVEGFAERSKIEATLDLPEKLDRFLPEVEIAVFRAIQECLTNVHRHSGSQSCSITVTQDETHLHVEVRDRGKGIPKDKQQTMTSGGVGLRGMRERLRQLGGTVKIQSSESGTTVQVTLPISEAAVRVEGAA